MLPIGSIRLGAQLLVKSAVRWVGPALFALVAAAVRAAVDPMSPGVVPFVTLFPAVLIATLLWGAGSGLLTLALSAMLGLYLWLAPRHSFALASTGEVLSLAIFVGASCFLVFVGHLFYRRTEGPRGEARPPDDR